MTTPRVGAVVRCGHLVTGVYASVSSLLQASLPIAKGSLVADPTTPQSADPWLTAFANVHGLRFIRIERSEPGAGWNAGLTGAGPVDYAICLESGDTLDHRSIERMARRLDEAPGATFVTCGIEWLEPASSRSFTVPAGCSAADILGDTRAAHVSSLFRWSAWLAGTRFDETLPALEHCDFWLSLISGGHTGLVEAAPLLRRRVHSRAIYSQSWLSPAYGDAAQRVFDRYGDLVNDVASLLVLKERAVLREYRRHEDLKLRRSRVGEQTQAMKARIGELTSAIPDIERPRIEADVFQRTSPLSHDWGYDRGTPADRPLIEKFLAAHRADVQGIVLEVQEDDYTRRFGGQKVLRADVIDVDPRNPRATAIADLRAPHQIASETYDCIILTQTLHVVDDMPAVVAQCHRLLRAGGVLLATLPCASRVCLEYGQAGDFWRVTEAGARHLFGDEFGSAEVETTPLGNAIVSAAFMLGMADSDLPGSAYDATDPYFPMLIGVRARKTRSAPAPVRAHRPLKPQGVVLLYHRVGPDDRDPHRLSVSPENFQAQLEWLRSTCDVMPLAQLAQRAGHSERSVALTFDDGYLDNVTSALPLLRRTSVPATFFLTTGDGPIPYRYWWDRLAALIASECGTAPLILHLPSGRTELPASSIEERRAAYWRIYEKVLRLPVAEREAVVAEAVAWAGDVPPRSDDRRMTWEEIRQLSSEPLVSIGAHTVEHLWLPAQPLAVLREELVSCRATLEDQCGTPVESLAYPFGAFDQRVVEAAGDAGYRLAVTCEPRAVSSTDDPLALPRIEVADEPIEPFIARVERALGVRVS